MNICIINSFTFHYEMFGYIMYYVKKNKYKLTIITPEINDYGWFKFYKNHFKIDYDLINIINIKNINFTKFDIFFLTTDDDKIINKINIDLSKVISIDHNSLIRNNIQLENHIGVRPFSSNYRQWALPCYKIKKFKNTSVINIPKNNDEILITIIGGNNDYNINILKKIKSKNKIILNIISRSVSIDKTILNNFYSINIYEKISTKEILKILEKTDYVLTDITYNEDHIYGHSMSGAIPLAFSTLVPLIISKQNNKLYKFKNVIEFDIIYDKYIIIEKNVINLLDLKKERNNLINMFDNILNNYCQNINIKITITGLIIEPRKIDYTPILIKDYQNKLKNYNIKYVFYCGKGLKEYYTNELSNIEIRELSTNNLNSCQYSDLLKTKELWETLYGQFVLIFQLDTYIIEKPPYTLQYFIDKNYSYIGGNMKYIWDELKRENIFLEAYNFNGGLSLRKREDMIKIINNYTPQETILYSKCINTDLEDVYFTLGAFKLNLNMSTTIDTSCFALHTKYYEKFFGIHKPNKSVYFELSQTYPEISNNKYLYIT